MTFDSNSATTEEMARCQIGDFVWVDHTLYEVKGINEKDQLLLERCDPLRIRMLPQ